MELRHLRYFLALAERLHFAQAAEQVHVTQSTLSHQIKQLEDELGERLFERLSNRVTLTQAGTLFRTYATQALASVDAGIRTLKQASGQLTGEIRVGAGQSFCAWLIPTCIQAFHSKNPDVRIVVEDVFASYLMEHLASGELDLGIGYRPEGKSGIVFEPLYDEEMRLVVGDGHPLAERKRVRMVELHNQALVLLRRTFATRLLLDECFASVGAEPNVIVETTSNVTSLAVARTLNIGTIAAGHPALSTPGLRVVALESPTPSRTFGLLWKRDAAKSIAIQAFAAVVRAASQDALRQASARL